MDNRAIIQRIITEKPALNLADRVASQGFLCSAVNLQQTSKQLTFNMLSNQGAVLNVENRLDINDMFTITHWGLLLVKAGTTTAASDTEISSAVPYSYPNALVFTGASEAPNLMNLYSGKMYVNIDGTNILTGYDCRRFYRVGTAQKGVGPAVITTNDEWQTPNYAMDMLDPQVTLNGGGKITVQLILPNAVSTVGTASTNVLLLLCRGILWQNASKLNAR